MNVDRLRALELRFLSLQPQAAGIVAAIEPVRDRLRDRKSEALRLAAPLVLTPSAQPSEWVAVLTQAQAAGVPCGSALHAARGAVQAVQELESLNAALAAVNAELAPLGKLIERCRKWAGLASD